MATGKPDFSSSELEQTLRDARGTEPSSQDIEDAVVMLANDFRVGQLAVFLATERRLAEVERERDAALENEKKLEALLLTATFPGGSTSLDTASVRAGDFDLEQAIRLARDLGDELPSNDFLELLYSIYCSGWEAKNTRRPLFTYSGWLRSVEDSISVKKVAALAAPPVTPKDGA